MALQPLPSIRKLFSCTCKMYSDRLKSLHTQEFVLRAVNLQFILISA